MKELTTEVEIRSEEFFKSNVEGYWEPTVLIYCSDDIFCSDWIYCC